MPRGTEGGFKTNRGRSIVGERGEGCGGARKIRGIFTRPLWLPCSPALILGGTASGSETNSPHWSKDARLITNHREIFLTHVSPSHACFVMSRASFDQCG